MMLVCEALTAIRSLFRPVVLLGVLRKPSPSAYPVKSGFFSMAEHPRSSTRWFTETRPWLS